jgi:peptidylprolyl isomerase
MERVQEGNTVAIHYTATLQDGTVFDKTAKDEPLTFTQGDGKALPAVDQAVIGMAPGESKTIWVSELDLHGAHDPGLVVELDRAEFSKRGIKPEIGLALEIKDGSNGKIEPRIFRVTSFSDTTVTMDGNHPLAGHSLTFDLRLDMIR